MTASEPKSAPAYRVRRDVVSGAVTEWDTPSDGEIGTTNTATFMLLHDPGGQLWIKLAVGEEWVYLRPENAQDFARDFQSQSIKWSNCHWDLVLDACVSQTCSFSPGKSHIGRLEEWQKRRTHRVEGQERTEEILRLKAAGLTVDQIAVRVGWSNNVIYRTLRTAR